MNNKVAGTLMAMASLYGALCLNSHEGYNASVKKSNVKGLSAKEMGTASKRKHKKRRRKIC